jgi:hypothetical protein
MKGVVHLGQIYHLCDAKSKRLRGRGQPEHIIAEAYLNFKFVLSYLLDLEEAFDRIQGIKYVSIQCWLVSTFRSFLPLISVSGRICNTNLNVISSNSIAGCFLVVMYCCVMKRLLIFESQILYHRKEIFFYVLKRLSAIFLNRYLWIVILLLQNNSFPRNGNQYKYEQQVVHNHQRKKPTR